MPDDILVSVILPVFNGARFLEGAIRSVLAQTRRQLEIVVVDDGSADATPEILARLAAEDRRVRPLRQARGGVARARNAAIAAAAGELVAPIDADDLWHPSKLELQVKRLDDAGPGTAVAACWWLWIDEEGRVLGPGEEHGEEGAVLPALIGSNFLGNASTPLMRRAAILEAGGYDPGLADRGAGGCEDYKLALAIAERHHFALVPRHLVGYRRVAGSMSSDNRRMKRSYDLVMGEFRRRRPDLPRHLFVRSNSRFSRYVADGAARAGDRAAYARLALGVALSDPVFFARAFLLPPRLKAALGLGRGPADAVPPLERFPTAGE